MLKDTVHPKKQAVALPEDALDTRGLPTVPPAPSPVNPVLTNKKTNAQRKQTLIVRIGQILLGLCLLGLWQLVASFQLIEPVLAKGPLDAWNYTVEAWQTGELQVHTWATMKAVLIAWVLASIVGIIVGVALGLMPTVERIVNPFFDAANAMPRLALAPLFIVVFGITLSAKVALAVTLVFFIVCSSARAGVRSTDDEWLKLSVVLGASKIQVFTRILLPVATPAIFSGLRLGLIYSLLGVVGSELISARDGLGQLVAMYSSQFRMEAVYAILIVLAIIAVILNQLMSLAEARLLRWQAPTQN